MGEWVVRAGEAQPQHLIDGYKEHLSALGIYGFSVAYNPGSSVDELVRAGQFPIPTISYQDDDVLQAAVAPLGYRLGFIRTPGRGYHHTCKVIYDATGKALQALPPAAAQAISAAFLRGANPHRARRPRPQP